jgi:hypothetical protein
MPTYTITDPNTGKTIKLTGDSEPTEQELNDIFSSSEMKQDAPTLKPKMEEQNVIGATFNVPGAAIRSAIQGKGYVEGAMNPSAVPKFQDLAIKAAQQSTNPYVNAILGMPASALGMAADIATSPADAIGMLAGGLGGVRTAVAKEVGAIADTGVGRAIGGVMTAKITPIAWVKDTFTGVKKAEKSASALKENIRKEASAGIDEIKSIGIRAKRVISKLEQKQQSALEQDKAGLAKALDYAEEVYTGKIKDTSFTKSDEVRKSLPTLFRAKSEEYGQGLNDILTARPVQTSASEITPVLEDSLMSHGLLKYDEAGNIVATRSPANKAEAQIMAQYKALKESPEAMIDTGDLLKSQQLIRPKFGRQWSPSDHLQSQVSEGLSGIVAQKSPEVAAYRKAYAPFLEWKKAAIKEFQPFAGKFANKKGTQILSKYADTNKTLTSDEVRLMSELERQTQKDFTSELKNIRGLGRDIQNRKEASKILGKVKGKEIDDAILSKKQTLDDLVSSRVEALKQKTDLKIDDINQETKDIIDALHRRRIILGAVAASTAGPAFLKYIKNRIAYGVFGITGN